MEFVPRKLPQTLIQHTEDELKEIHSLEVLGLLLQARDSTAKLLVQPVSWYFKSVCNCTPYYYCSLRMKESNKEIETISQNWPYLTLLKYDSTIQLIMVVESNPTPFRLTGFRAIKALIGAYFTFNIEYPRALAELMRRWRRLSRRQRRRSRNQVLVERASMQH